MVASTAGNGSTPASTDGADNLALGWIDGLGAMPPTGARVGPVAVPAHGAACPAHAARFVPERDEGMQAEPRFTVST